MGFSDRPGPHRTSACLKRARSGSPTDVEQHTGLCNGVTANIGCSPSWRSRQLNLTSRGGNGSANPTMSSSWTRT